MSVCLCEWTGNCSSCWVVRLDTVSKSFWRNLGEKARLRPTVRLQFLNFSYLQRVLLNSLNSLFNSLLHSQTWTQTRKLLKTYFYTSKHHRSNWGGWYALLMSTAESWESSFLTQTSPNSLENKLKIIILRSSAICVNLPDCLIFFF